MRSFTLGKRVVGGGAPVLVIAEMAWAHDGDREKAVRMARGAAEAGADALSVHVTSVPDYMVAHYGNPGTVSAGKPTSKIYEYLAQINLDRPAVAAVAEAARAAGLAVVLMPNDLPSLEFSRSLGPDGYVLSPACFTDEAFVRALAASDRPVVPRIGGSTLGEIERTVGWLRDAGCRDLVLLHGFQVYPTPLEELNLRAIPTLARIFDCPVGLADHIDGGDELALALPAVAIALGAAALEKHITWDREERGEDFESALDPARFARFVRIVRAAEVAVGGEAVGPFSADVVKYRQVVRKRVVSAMDLPRGTVIEARHLACKRSDDGVGPEDRVHLIGRRLRAALATGDPVTFATVE